MLVQAVAYFALALLLDAYHTGRLRVPLWLSKLLQPVVERYQCLAQRLVQRCKTAWGKARGWKGSSGARRQDAAKGETELAEQSEHSRWVWTQ